MSTRTPTRTVFVGNIPYDVSEEQLLGIFRQVGPVKAFRLVSDPAGKPKGFGFVEYYDYETAASAVRNLREFDIGGRTLRVDYAENDSGVKDDRSRSSGNNNNNSSGSNRRGYGGSGNNQQQLGPPQQQMPMYGYQPQPHMGYMPMMPMQTPGMAPMGYTGGQGPMSGIGGGAIGLPTPQQQQHQQPPQQMQQVMMQAQQQQPAMQPQQQQTPQDPIAAILQTSSPNDLLNTLGAMKDLIQTDEMQARTLLTQNPQLCYALFQALVLLKIVNPNVIQQVIQSSYQTSAPTYQQQPQAAGNSTTQQPIPDLSHVPEPQRQALMQVIQMTEAQINVLPPEQRQQVLMIRAQYGIIMH